MRDRFREFNPEEREILYALLNAHANSVSMIAVNCELKVAAYLAKIEALEVECRGRG